MTGESQANLPNRWKLADLCEVAELNPRLDKSAHTDNPMVSFVPMPGVEAGTGAIDVSQTRSLEEVKKGYTPFREGDVIFAKITPCMENGKMAVIPPLKNDLGFGSTEFHVLRPYYEISAQYIYFFVSSESFRRDAEHNMTGAVGQRRVPTSYLADQSVPVPPAREQRRIVAKIEELFSELDKGVESLKTARAQLNVYRQSVLKHAFEGKLTAQWREENKDKLETSEQLLARIKQEQEARYEQQLQEWKIAVKQWEESGKSGKKPAKPKPVKCPSPISQEDRERLLDLPDRWAWVRLGQLFSISPQNGVYKPASEYGSGTQIIRIDDFYDGRLIRRTGFRKLRLSNEEIEKYKVQNSDLIINRVNSIEYLGKCALVEDLTENTVFESNIMRCCVIEDVISKAYVAAYLASREGRNRLCENAKHAVNQASINQTDVGNTLVPITFMEEQILIVQKIEQKLSQTDALISQIEDHLKKVEALRQSILKKAFSGQLVPQDPNDEPASVLLDRIRAEREQVAKNNHSKKTKKRKTTA